MVKTLLFILSVLPATLAGEFNPQTLSDFEQDSILAIGNPSQVVSRYRLECENEQRVFRHSRVADWYLVDTEKNKRKRLGEGISDLTKDRVRDAVLSPNGRYVAFAIANNLYIHKIDFGKKYFEHLDTLINFNKIPNFVSYF